MKFNKYKEQNGLDTQEKLLKHIDELKRNTVVNQELVNFLVDDFFAGEKRGTSSTRHKSRSGETHTVFSTPAGLKDVNKTVVIELENPLEFPQLKSNSWSDLVQDKDRIVFKNSEEVKTNLKQDNFAGLFNILEPNEDKETEEDKLIFHFRKEGLPHSDVVVLDSPDQVEEYAKKNGYTEWSYLGLLSGFINEKYINPLYKAVSDDVISNSNREGLEGFKEAQTTNKAPIFTFCKQMKNAIEQLAFRSEYGHNKYRQYDADWNNFARVENGNEEYGNSEFRHALEIGEDSELEHYVASAWNSIARLEIYLRKNLQESK